MKFTTEDLINIKMELLNPQVDERKKYDYLKAILKQHQTIEQLNDSKLGKSVKRCTKIGGKIGDISHIIIKKWTDLIEQHSSNKSQTKPHEVAMIEKTPSSLDKMKFHKLVNDRTMSNKADEINRKRRSHETVSSNSCKQQKVMDTSFIPHKLPEFTELDILSLSTSNRSDLCSSLKTKQAKDNYLEDIDVTKKYASERKVWVPKSKFVSQEGDEGVAECECINNTPVSVIAQFSAKQLVAFEANSREIMRQTKEFWQKLFAKHFKFSSRNDGEKWRDAYFRVEREEDAKLKNISERLNKKSAISKKNETRAMIITVPLKPVARRSAGFHR